MELAAELQRQAARMAASCVRRLIHVVTNRRLGIDPLYRLLVRFDLRGWCEVSSWFLLLDAVILGRLLWNQKPGSGLLRVLQLLTDVYALYVVFVFLQGQLIGSAAQSEVWSKHPQWRRCLLGRNRTINQFIDEPVKGLIHETPHSLKRVDVGLRSSSACWEAELSCGMLIQ